MRSEKLGIITVFATALLVAVVIIAGCTQDSGSASGSSAGTTAGTSQQAAPGSTDTGTSQDTSGSQSVSHGVGTLGSQTSGYSGNASRQYSAGQNFLTNETRLSAAATKLGVSEQDLKNALTPANGQRVNFTDAAAQMGVTPDQLRDAFGFPAGGAYHGNRTAPAGTPATGQ
ncbi:hypothetical protein [Methanoregula sp. UBA64]|jgi:hypothetical protein|uniref:hypothetical protein n=1 Tax=Methanoregula sp. UBA64 TaxID=1915554 RepID=UPI0025F4281C|nr:hypothetical protein [Methanoregula sp. UBA64]